MKFVGVFSVATTLLCLSSGLWPSEANIVRLLPAVISNVLGIVHEEPPPEASMSTPEIITYHGYTVEEHNVTTEDGYILTMFRIPRGKTTNATKEPVIVQHGLLCSSNDWLLIEPEDILPYLLVEDGHEVFLTNCRGNNYSMAHVTLSPSDPKFWNFSFHEMGVYDVPAVINYVLKITNSSQLYWVGHSMGTTMFFIGMVRHPELQSKVKKMVALSPVAYINHLKTVLGALAFAPPTATLLLFNLLSGGRVIPSVVNQWINDYGGETCTGTAPSLACNNIMFLIAGFDNEQTTNRTASMITSHTPSDASVKTLEHYLQFVRTGEFKEYGDDSDAFYNLSTNRVPTLAFFGDNDLLCVPQDANRAISELGNATPVRVNFTKFNHLDHTYAKDVKTLVYNRLVAYVSQ